MVKIKNQVVCLQVDWWAKFAILRSVANHKNMTFNIDIRSGSPFLVGVAIEEFGLFEQS